MPLLPSRRRSAASWRWSLVVAVHLMSACGSSGEPSAPVAPPTPPPPTVATVEVSPATVSRLPPDTVRLSAVARDASGNVLTGRTVTWASSATTVASVTSDGLVSLVAAGQATITATVDGRSGSAQVTGVPPLDVVSSATTSRTIGAAGGVLTTSVNGVPYRLIIPPGALNRDESIRMTPLSALRTLRRVQFEAGVLLQPSGLQFRVPVRLEIGRRVTLTGGRRPVGITTDSAGRNVALSLAELDSLGQPVLHFTHFSTESVGSATSEEAAGEAPPPSVPARLDSWDAGVAALLAAFLAGELDGATANPILFRWFDEWLRPLLTAAESGQGSRSGSQVMPSFEAWQDVVFARSNLDGAAIAQLQTARGVALDVLRRWRGRLLGECAFATRADGARLVGEAGTLNGWYFELFLGPLPDPLLDVLYQDLCLRVVVTDSTYPDPAIANADAPLTLRAGLKVANDPQLLDGVFRVGIDVFGGTPGFTDGETDAGGRFTATIRPSGAESMVAVASICFDGAQVQVGAPYYDRYFVCGVARIERTFGRVIQGDVIVASTQGLDGLANVGEITGRLEIRSTVDSPDLAPLATLHTVRGEISIAGAQRTLTGLRSLRRARGISIFSTAAVLERLDGLEGLTELGTLAIDAPALRNVDGIRNLERVGFLRLRGVAALTSLRGFQGIEIGTLGTAPARGLEINTLQNITTLADLRPLAADFPGTILINNNPRLADLAVLRSVTRTRQWVTIDRNPSLANLRHLDALRIVDGEVFLSVSGTTAGDSVSLIEAGHVRLVGASAVRFPRLTTVNGTLHVYGGTACAAGAVRRLEFPSLVTIAADLVLGQIGSPATCAFDFFAPSLATVGGAVGIGGASGARDVSIGGATLGGARIYDSVGLRSIAAPGIRVRGSVEVVRNADLLTASGVSGRIDRDLLVVDNPRLDHCGTLRWVQTMSIGGLVTVSGNANEGQTCQ